MPDGAEARIARFDAIQQEAVVRLATARNRQASCRCGRSKWWRARCRFRWERAGGDRRELNEVPAAQRQIHDCLLLQHLADGGALAVEQRGGRGRDGHGFRDLAERQFDLHASALADLDPDVRHFLLLKARRCDGQADIVRVSAVEGSRYRSYP